MPVFHLQPTSDGLDSPAWVMSWHRGACYVVAENAERARLYANCAFIIPLQSAIEPAFHETRPWSSEKLVEATIVKEAAEFGSLGSVELDTPAGLSKAYSGRYINSRSRSIDGINSKFLDAA